MQVVILCGGKGMRLREETEFRPKPLIAVGNKPILWHIMRYYAHFGHKDFVLCLGYRGEMIKDYFLHYRSLNNDFTLHMGDKPARITYHTDDVEGNPDWNITFVDTGEETQTGGRIARIQEYLHEDEEDFFLTYGDGLSNININELYTFHKQKNVIATLSGTKPMNPFGVIKPVGGFAERFHEKPKDEDAFINGGFMACSKRIFTYLSTEESHVFETDALPKLAHDRQLGVFEHRGFWHCMDTMKHMNDLNAMYAQGNRPWMLWEKQKNSEA